MQKSVCELMSVDFVSVSSQMRLDEALEMLVDADATELCVIDDEGRLEGIVTDYELLKASLTGDLQERTITSYVSRAVTIVPATATMQQVVPLFRDGVCSRAYVCDAGKVVGRLARATVLRFLCDRARSIAMPRPLSLIITDGRTSTIQHRAELPRPPQFLTTSVLGSVGS